MGEIDGQRISAVRKLHELGLAWHAGAWRNSDEADSLREADAMHALLVQRADALEGCSEGSPEETELSSIIDVVEAYEEKRRPLGKIPGGKG
jgi:hypothetical protein